MQKRILVLGATGMLGRPVVQQLQKDGFQVRVLARDVEKVKAQFDGSVEIVQGDVADLDRLESALEGCYGAHVSVGGDVDQISAENVADLAPKLGLERITYISALPWLKRIAGFRWLPRN
jgi:uncharacterized protein YbjT (DUF2867 family)